jgi:hypothetical protein
VLYWPAIGDGRVFFERDIYNYWHPYVVWALASLSRGESLGWNPGVQFGMPFLSDPNFQVFYPPTWLLLILSPDRFYTLLVAGHAILAGLGVARLLESYGLERGAVAGSVAMALSGPFVSMANLWHHYCGAAWIPWLVWAVRRLGQTSGRSWRSCALTLGLTALSGSAESVVMGAILAACTQWPLFTGRAMAVRLALSAVIGASLGAVQWAPTVALLSSTARMGLGLDEKLGWSLSPDRLGEFVTAGDPRSRQLLPENLSTPLVEDDIPLIVGPYLGAFALPLALLGAWRLPGFLVLGVCAIVASLGRHLPSPLPEWLTVLPFRYPTKILIMASVAFAMLVGAGAHVLLSRPAPLCWGRRRERGVLALAALVAVWAESFGVSGDWSSRASRSALFFVSGALATVAGPGAGWVMAGALILDGRSGLGWVNQYASPALFRFKPPAVDVLRRLGPHPRIFVAFAGESWAQADLNQRGQKSSSIFQATLGEILFPPHGLPFGIWNGFQPEFNGLGSIEMRSFSRFLDQRFRSDVRRYLSLGAIDAVVSTDNTNPLGAAEPLARFEGITSTATRVDLWGKIPRASLARHVTRAGSLAESMETVAAPGFSPGADAVVQDLAQGPGVRESLAGGEARIVVDRTDRVDIAVDSKGPGLLVLRDAYWAGWSARVDDRPSPVLRTDVLFRAVRIPAGRSLVSFRYTTPGSWWGGVLCALAVLALTLRRLGGMVRS